jgi:hypothetical protein
VVGKNESNDLLEGVSECIELAGYFTCLLKTQV